jgi:signal transduction histidine kinase
MPNRERLPSILGRLTHKLAWMTLLISTLVCGSTWLLLERHFSELSDYRLAEAADILSLAVDTLHQANNHQGLVLPDDEQEEKYVWQVIEAATGRLHSRSEQAPARALAAAPSNAYLNSPDGVWHIVTRPLGKNPQYFFLLAQKRSQVIEVIGSLVISNVGVVLVIALAFSLSVVYLVRRELRPLIELGRSVKAYDPMHLEPAPLKSGWAELAPMEESINDMGQRLSRRLLSERAFNLHAAHALRTPLASLKMEIQLARTVPDAEIRQWVQRAGRTVDRLIQVMTSLLSLFRSGSGAQLKPTPVRELLTLWTADAPTLEVSGLQSVECDGDLLSGVLLNLLDNAREHGADRVLLTAARYQNGWYSLFLRDNGRGCPPDHLRQLRSDLEQHNFDQGSALKGLGLMLADVVMSAHHGQVRLPKVREGFCIELTWPGPTAAA